MLHLERISCLGEALRDTCVAHKSREALIEAERHRENGRWTYAELRAAAERFAARLQARGVQPGDRVAILMQNQARWLIGATGALWAGAVLVPLDYKLTAPEQAALLAHGQPKVLLTEYATYRKLREAAADLSDRTVFVTDAPDGEDLGGAIAWDDGAEDGPFTYHARARDDVACIVYSSGTGGTPKGCMLTHGNYLAQAQILSQVFPFDEGARYFSVLPTNHAIDFMAGYILAFLLGATVVHQRTLRPQFLTATMKRYQITHMALVPTILKSIERRIRDKIEGLDGWQRLAVDALIRANEVATLRRPRPRLSRALLRPVHEEFGGHLEVIFAGGAFVDPKMADFFYSLGIPIAIGYGLTEAGTVLAVNDLKPFRADSVGRPVPGVEVEIRNPNDEGVGEVWVRGPVVMAGYLDEPELTAEALVDGWLRTGDLGTIDASGHLHLRGRSKNMIVTEGGKNIYPEDIEAAFEGLRECEELCVFAADYLWPRGAMTGEQLVVAVRPKGEDVSEALLEDLRARNRRLPDFKRVSGYIPWTQEFPRTASMKVKRGVLADELRAASRAERVREL